MTAGFLLGPAENWLRVNFPTYRATVYPTSVTLCSLQGTRRRHCFSEDSDAVAQNMMSTDSYRLFRCRRGVRGVVVSARRFVEPKVTVQSRSSTLFIPSVKLTDGFRNVWKGKNRGDDVESANACSESELATGGRGLSGSFTVAGGIGTGEDCRSSRLPTVHVG